MPPSVPAPHPSCDPSLPSLAEEGFDGLATSLDRALAITHDAMERLGHAFFHLHGHVTRPMTGATHRDPGPSAAPALPPAVSAAVDQSVTCLQFEDLLTQVLEDVQTRIGALREVVDALARHPGTEGDGEAPRQALRARLAGRSDSLAHPGTGPGEVEIF